MTTKERERRIALRRGHQTLRMLRAEKLDRARQRLIERAGRVIREADDMQDVVEAAGIIARTEKLRRGA